MRFQTITYPFRSTEMNEWQEFNNCNPFPFFQGWASRVTLIMITNSPVTISGRYMFYQSGIVSWNARTCIHDAKVMYVYLYSHLAVTLSLSGIESKTRISCFQGLQFPRGPWVETQVSPSLATTLFFMLPLVWMLITSFWESSTNEKNLKQNIS